MKKKTKTQQQQLVGKRKRDEVYKKERKHFDFDFSAWVSLSFLLRLDSSIIIII